MFNLLDTVVLTRDVPHAGLRQGDLGAIVEVHAPNVFEVEFVAASGRTQALVTLTADDLRHVDDHDLVSVRPLEQATG
jgi:pyridoxine 5'-phosphate synthase PdxJ